MKTGKISLAVIGVLLAVSLFMVTGMRVFNSFFVERRLESATERLSVFLVIVAVLLTIASVIIKRILEPLEMILVKLDQGQMPGLDKRLAARKGINLLPMVFILVNVIGFFLGPIIMMLVSFLTRGESVFTTQNALTVVYNVSIGLVSALEEILLSNIILSRAKRRLGIHQLNKRGGKDVPLAVRNVLLPMALCLFVGLTVFTAGWGYLQEAMGGYEDQVRDNKISSLSYQEGERLYLGELGFALFFILTVSGLVALSYSMDNVNQIKGLKNQLLQFRQGKGDLTLRCDIVHFDELGELSGEINLFIDFLHGLLSKVKEAVGGVTGATQSLNHSLLDMGQTLEGLRLSSTEVRTSSKDQISVAENTKDVVEEILKTIDELNSSIEAQASFVEESSSAITEMTAGIMNINQTVQKANEMSKGLEKMSLLGDEKIADTLEKMNDIARASEIVEEIVAMISTVAEQTDMLALNAAIEAAHAGESGKGFAVVAEEIRKLAEDSNSSTSDISNQLKEIKQQIRSGVSSSEETSNTLQNIISEIGKQLVMISEIANAIGEQSAGAKQILTATETVVSTTQSMKDTAQLQRQKNQAIQNQLGQLLDSSQLIEKRVGVQMTQYESLKTLVEKIKKVFDANQDLVAQLEDRISLFRV
ncbi:MAG: methyl-accepting chemotaxis protein [Spirochaetales bacterium]|nr:methyl-accepting chemotaxis protein [Spirochaetales bacterium]